jgi:hypothetical protein
LAFEGGWVGLVIAKPPNVLAPIFKKARRVGSPELIAMSVPLRDFGAVRKAQYQGFSSAQLWRILRVSKFADSSADSPVEFPALQSVFLSPSWHWG